jgi:hypothetical protein
MTTNNDDLSNKEDVVVKEQQPTTTYAELYEKLYPKPDTEQLKKNAKRARTRNIIAALGDGISAIANLHYTTKGAPNMYDGKSTLTAKSQARYDKLMQDYKDNLDKYKQGQLKAEQLDKEWNHRAEREKVADDQWKQSFEHTKKRAEVADEQWKQSFDYTKGRNEVLDERYRTEQEAKAAAAKQAQENWKAQFDESVRQFDERMKKIGSTSGKNGKSGSSKSNSSTSGKNDNGTFSLTNGRVRFSIDNDTWDGEYADIYDIYRLSKMRDGQMADDGLTGRKIKKKDVETIISKDWYNSPTFVQFLKDYGYLDGEDVTSDSEESNADEDLSFSFNDNSNNDLDW